MKVCVEIQEENWSAFCPDSLRISESTRAKAKHLILQCRGYNRLKKYANAIEIGKKCLEIADQFNHPDQDLIKMEAALELWRAYEMLNQDDDAATYQRKYLELTLHYV